MLAAILTATLVITVFSMYRRHYLFGVSVALFGLYELLGPLFYLFDDYDQLVIATRIYDLVATPQLVDVHLELIAQFLVFFVGAYVGMPFLIERVFSWRFASTLFRNDEVTSPEHFKRYYVLLGVLFVFGVISAFQDVGTLRLHDYRGYEYYTTPFYSYGTLLIICAAPLIVYALKQKQWVRVMWLLITIVPLGSQIFISSRRQRSST